MIKKALVSLGVALVLTAGAGASTVSIVAPDKVVVGAAFEIQIVGDFGAEGLHSGGVQLLYDAALLSISFESFNLNVDPFLSCPGLPLCPDDPAGTISIAWGQRLFDLIAPDAGPTVMATLNAVALAETAGSGLSLVSFTAITGEWFGAGFVLIATPEFLPADIEANVPLPAAVWLLIGGLGALAGFRRRAAP